MQTVADRLAEDIASDARRQFLRFFEVLKCEGRISLHTIAARILLPHADLRDRVIFGGRSFQPHRRFFRIFIDIGARIEHLRQRQPGIYIAAGRRLTVPLIGLFEILLHTGAGLIASSEIKTGKRMSGFGRLTEHREGLLVHRLHFLFALKSRRRLCIRVMKHIGADSVSDLIVKVPVFLFHTVYYLTIFLPGSFGVQPDPLFPSSPA